jgi:hypothetical protein
MPEMKPWGMLIGMEVPTKRKVQIVNLHRKKKII